MSPPAPIGPYQTLREIGRGGMDIVYLARDGALNLSCRHVLSCETISAGFLIPNNAILRFVHSPDAPSVAATP